MRRACSTCKLAEDGARLATGCTYKFLNGGPGAPAFVYVRGELAGRMQSPISGWFGHADPFAFDAGYAPRAGVARFAAGTPGVLSLSALDAALDAFEGYALGDIAAKARALGDLVIARAEAMGLEAISPKDAGRRGGHVSVRHAQGYAVVQALIARGIIPDFRAPDAMRFGRGAALRPVCGCVGRDGPAGRHTGDAGVGQAGVPCACGGDLSPIPRSRRRPAAAAGAGWDRRRRA